MVARIIDIREFYKGGRSLVDISFEVTRIVNGGTLTTIVSDLTFDRRVLDNDDELVDSIQSKLRGMFPRLSPRNYIGLEIQIDGG